MKKNTSFKKCGVCGFEWGSRDEFLQDSNVEIVGYQVNFAELMLGVFLFNHSCKATLAIESGDFRNLYDGPIFKTPVTGSEECPSYCLHQEELGPCPAQCECAYVRKIIQIIKNRSKD